MNKEMHDRIKKAFINEKHVVSNSQYKYIGRIEITPIEIYLLEKIEDLEAQVDKLKRKKTKDKPA